jgi:hypothetical protein
MKEANEFVKELTRKCPKSWDVKHVTAYVEISKTCFRPLAWLRPLYLIDMLLNLLLQNTGGTREIESRPSCCL